MSFDRRTRHASTSAAAQHSAPAPGKRTLTETLPVQRREITAPQRAEPTGSKIAASLPTSLPDATARQQMLFSVQRAATAAVEVPAQVHAAAARGTATAASKLPFADRIQRAFGRHDVSGIQAHVGPEAAASAGAMGARAYATGNDVVLGAGADLHTVAHEAAHVVQQRAGVHLKGGVGDVGDAYEQHADAVADLVVQGKSAEGLLDAYAPSSGDRGAPSGAAAHGVQRRIIAPGGQSLSWEEVLQAVGGSIQNRRAYDHLLQMWREPDTTYTLPEIQHALGGPPVHPELQGPPHPGVQGPPPPGLQGPPPLGLPGPPARPPAELLQEKMHACWFGYTDPGLVECVLRELTAAGSTVDQVKIVDSSGSVMTFIIDNAPVVIQHYRSEHAFTNKLEYFHRLEQAGQGHPAAAASVARIHRIEPEHRNLYVEKVQPINGLFPAQGGATFEERHAARERAAAALRVFVQRNALKILHDCSKAIDALAGVQLSQADVRVDNVGIKDGKFVLFDFNLVQKSSRRTVEIDHTTLIESLKMHGCDDVLEIRHYSELVSELDDVDFEGLTINFSVD